MKDTNNVAAYEARDAIDQANYGGNGQRVAAYHAEPDPLAYLSPVSAGRLLREFPELREPVIHGILRATETMNVISTSKSRKTWTVQALGLSIATGRPWLGNPVAQGQVLYIDAELHKNTFAHRLHSIAEAMGISRDQFADTFEAIHLRGRLLDIVRMAPIFARIPKGKYRIIILDALYRLIPPGVDENSNSDMTPIYNMIDSYAEQTGAAFVIVHHASKGSQSGKSITDVGSGAGAQSRATDSHLILREHQESEVVVMETVCRSFAQPAAQCLRWTFPLWTPAPELNPNDLKETTRRRKAPKNDAVPASAPPKIEWTPARFVESFIKTTPTEKSVITARAEQVMSVRQANNLLRLAEDEGLVHRWTPANPKHPVRFATVRQPVTDTGSSKP